MFEMVNLTPVDWARLRDLRIAALSDSTSISGDLEEEQTAKSDYWESLLAEQHWFALTWEGHDVGLVVLALPPEDRYGDCWIKSWWIAPEFRGKGGARVMSDWLTNFAKEKHWRIQALGVFESNQSAIASYERLGFVNVGIRKQSSRLNEFFIIMAREITLD